MSAAIFPNVHAPRTACAIDLALLYSLLATGRFDLTAEKATQADIEALLLKHLPADKISREHRLEPGDIPDFLIGGRIVIEVKGPKHRAPAVTRQIKRYAAYPEVEAIIVATSKAMRLPASIEGKRVMVLELARAWL